MNRLYEVTVSVNNFALKVLFDKKPEFCHVREAARVVFANNEEVRDALIKLIDDLPSHAELSTDTDVVITDGDTHVGCINLETRTLFSIPE